MRVRFGISAEKTANAAGCRIILLVVDFIRRFVVVLGMLHHYLNSYSSLTGLRSKENPTTFHITHMQSSARIQKPYTDLTYVHVV